MADSGRVEGCLRVTMPGKPGQGDAVFGLEFAPRLPATTEGIVLVIVSAPPIAHWTIGKPARRIWHYYQSKGAQVELLT